MLKIRDLSVSKSGAKILDSLDFHSEEDEFHVIMGPNGSGKSTLAKTLAGHPGYTDYKGTIRFKNREISELKPDERLKSGLMLGFQHPPRIRGVKIKRFLGKVLEKVEGNGDSESREEKIKSATRKLGFSPDLLERNVNDGLSGGERKRLELLQARLVKPAIMILDEPDSGVDVDSLELISDEINSLYESGTSIILITHYGNLMEKTGLERPNVHLLKDGNIVTSGGENLVREVEKKGFNRIYEECGCN
jgi:Fe-S cluster assembly ATP-binding protein